MSTTYTPNYNLGKQTDHADKFDMTVITDNADKIDAALHNHDEELEDLGEGKQDTLTPAQLAAVNSGVTAEVLAADRAALIELIDGGPKNKLSWSAADKIHNGITFTVNGDGTVTASGTNDSSSNSFISIKVMTAAEIGAMAGCVLSGTPENSVGAYLSLEERGGSYTTYIRDRGSGATVPAISTEVNVYIVVPKGATVDGLIFRPMICSAAAWAVSHEFQPYRPSYEELYDMVQELQGGASLSSVQSTAQPTSISAGDNNADIM